MSQLLPYGALAVAMQHAPQEALLHRIAWPGPCLAYYERDILTLPDGKALKHVPLFALSATSARLHPAPVVWKALTLLRLPLAIAASDSLALVW